MSAAVGLVFLLTLHAQGVTAPSRAEEPLAQRKVREEIRQLELDNRNSTGIRGIVKCYGPFLAGFAALAGVLVTIWRHNYEQANQREKDRNLRETESRRRIDERFSTVLANLGAESEATQAAAAVSLLSFLQGDDTEFHRQVRLVTLANLKVAHSDVITNLLVRVFQQALRTRAPFEPVEIDFSHAHLRRADFSRLDLSGADFRAADLSRANFEGARLRRVEGYQVNLQDAGLCETDLDAARFPEAHAAGARFYKANLHAVHFEDADLRNARFQQAKLPSAHFDRADLRGARFEGSNLNDAYFREAQLDEGTLKSITRAQNWETAHFSEGVMARLRELGGRGGNA
jgi:uncharacterized protein YjbI with pentapeptide repeats